MTQLVRHAHQSGDGVQVMHCPMCGSGQVIGRSDGNIECQFCNTAFIVRVQPMYSAFPQSVGGMPVQIPGMPAPAPAPGAVPPGAPGAQPGAPEDGSQGDGGPPFDDGSADGGDGKSEDGDDSGGGPPFGKKESYRTAAGATVGREAYVAYLASSLRG
ncbi:hypothetical protein [Kitasatospora viridis]|uniref:Uncharacterized protein n=1 Tax=Kitasatospora viridis TaxID=281105 RepID=A0A561S9Y0_9ACTN|nr:hypothetical protein [Kitasatospora viridis]TWF71682.1 hypothetical protein FHX73_1853 [Kitasatospora viridis]